jgi:cobalt-zinc-cadmium efflux system protein
MFTDMAALAIALAAVRIGQRPADDKRTYGYRRFEILAAAFNAILLFVIAGFVLYEATGRFFDPAPVDSTGMLVVAALGLIVNLIAMRVLEGGRDASLNVKGAYLEVWADMLGSLGVLGAAAIIFMTKWYWVDALVAAAIGLWVLPRAWTLLRDTTHILLQGVPLRIDIGSVREAIEGVSGVHSVHDLHIWSVAGDDVSLTSHIVLYAEAEGERTRLAVTQMLDERFHIHHATVQIELERCESEVTHT